jgi:hypothetical protein
MSTTYRPIPVVFSEDDGDWLVDSSHDYNYLRCDCHDLLWHHSELHLVPDGEMRGMTDRLVCELGEDE